MNLIDTFTDKLIRNGEVIVRHDSNLLGYTWRSAACVIPLTIGNFAALIDAIDAGEELSPDNLRKRGALWNPEVGV